MKIDEIQELLRREDASRVKGTVEWFVHGPMLSLKERERLERQLRRLIKGRLRRDSDGVEGSMMTKKERVRLESQLRHLTKQEWNEDDLVDEASNQNPLRIQFPN